MGDTNSTDKLRIANFGLSYDFIDEYRGVNILNIKWSQGLNIFGASQSGALQLSRPEGRASFSKISGDIDIINLNKLFNPDAILVQLFKSELLNNKNLNINVIINAEQIIPFRDLNNLVFKFRIEDGLLDISETKFSWLDYVDFQIFDSLLYVRDNNLVLDSNISIDIHNSSEVYKFFQTPRNYRKKINKIKFNFIYNFDQEITNLNNIEIDNLVNPEVNKILDQFISKDTILQNRIYFKSLINEAIKSYAG